MAWFALIAACVVSACSASADHTGDEGELGGGAPTFDDGDEESEPHGAWVLDTVGALCGGYVRAVCGHRTDVFVAASNGVWRMTGDPALGPLELDDERELTGATSVACGDDVTWASGLGLWRKRGDAAWEELASSGPFVTASAFDGGVALVDADDGLWVWRDDGGLASIALGAGTRIRALTTSASGIFVRTNGGDPSGALWSIDTRTLEPVARASGDDVPPLQTLEIGDDGTLWGIAATQWGFHHHMGEVVRSVDGGVTFAAVEDLPEDFEAAYVTAGGGHVVIAESTVGRVLISTDGGMSFVVEDAGSEMRNRIDDIISLQVDDEGRVWVGGWCYGLAHRRAAL